MNIAIVASYNGQWTSHTGHIKAFADLGHDVSIFTTINEKGELNFNSLDILMDLKDTFELILVFGHGQIYDKRLNYRNFKCPIFAEMGDDPQRFNENIKCAELYDVLLTPDLPSVRQYKSAGWINTFWWTHCFDQEVFKPIQGMSNTDIVTGMYEYGRRTKLLDSLKNQNLFTFSNVVHKNPVDYNKQLNSGDIIFNCSNYGEITRRVFEGMACGKLLITDKLSELTGIYQFFSDGIHFVTYSSEAELIEKIEYYLDNDEERETIAEEGYKAVQDHSALERTKQLLDIYKETNK